jgi:hypothetical protein
LRGCDPREGGNMNTLDIPAIAAMLGASACD